MKSPHQLHTKIASWLHNWKPILCAAIFTMVPVAVSAQTPLADQPLFTYNSVPGNLMLSLSVEFPTAISIANPGTYSSSTSYIGYFDNTKCYVYNYDATTDLNNYFYPGLVANSDHSCPSNQGFWSGNFMNWAAMQTVDPFRWALTGGYRALDTTTTTLVEKAWGSTQGSASSNFPDRESSGAGTLTPFSGAALVNPLPFPHLTSVSYSSFGTRIWGLGNKMYFVLSNQSAGTINASMDAPALVTPYNPNDPVLGSAALLGGVYSVVVRVKVCDGSSTLPLETNCTQYGSNYKPEGLMQQYAQKIRYGAAGYLNDGSAQLDGGVLRARMAFVGPTTPVVNGNPVANSNSEWSGTTGVYNTNPDPADVTDTNTYYNNCSVLDPTTNQQVGCAQNSGVLNYLNKFGEFAHSYKTYDPVGELYYATMRYYRRYNAAGAQLGNVTAYTPVSASTSTNYGWIDGFPVITDWYKADASGNAQDPILYSCQKNFILGIGDIHTHFDGDLPGGSPFVSNEVSQPSQVLVDDAASNVQTYTNKVAQLENLEVSTSNSAGDDLNGNAVLGGGTNPTYANSFLKYTPWCCDSNTYYMAGIAYNGHTSDIRATDPRFLSAGVKNQAPSFVNSYWLDVLESSDYHWRNQFWLTAKYGGFAVPTGFDPINGTTPLTKASWDANNRTDAGFPNNQGTHAMPDNYYDASHADSLVSGLASAFQSISASLQAYTSAFSLSNPVVTTNGSVAYASQYDSSVWKGDVTGQAIVGVDINNNIVYGASWDGGSLLAARSAASRSIATCCAALTPTTPGIPFESTQLNNSAQTEYAALASTSPSATADQILAWLRGDHSQEIANGGLLRTRAGFVLGDIVNSKLVAVSAPSATFADSKNVGYSTFKSNYANRPAFVYVGANDGMLHAFDGTTALATSGAEVFAYVPSPTYQGPTNPQTDGLRSLANPNFVHHYFVDSTPIVQDVDMTRVNTTGSGSGTGWSSLLVGGLGKGGAGYYALDVTDPTGLVNSQPMTNETYLSTKVLWEFTKGANPTLGFSYGQPVIVKTKKYGWTVILTSGYNNADGVGYFYFVNPQTGALYEPPVSTHTGSSTVQSGLAPATAFINDFTDGTADAVYAGDLLGNVWRVDLTGTSGSYSIAVDGSGHGIPFAKLAGPTGVAQPITARPLVEIQPVSEARRVLVGTGELLSTTDISSTAVQSFYSLVDGTATGFAAISSPITRSSLASLSPTGTLTGLTPAAIAANPLGFYIDLGTGSGSNNAAYRINTNMVETQGIVAFIANLPLGDACNPSGSNELFAIDISSGQSNLTVTTGTGNSTVVTPVALVAGSGIGVGVNAITESGPGCLGSSCNGGIQIEQCNDKGVCADYGTQKNTAGLKKLNWRELPSAD